ncbi:DUF2489 domain-containing protein [Halomonas sp. YLGW01]|uniref:DUF2489 domain-containing protein n=1 Tax=Halomonas sp. YLGW01 TaxID=2773308 RepID=UPI0017857BD6|nr:DUF2489 domain-containing protein [Halomonas sp. YLGW01]
MSETMAWVLAGLAVVILAGLGAYAFTLWKEVRRREAFKRDEVERANQQCLYSLDAIARSMISRQVDLVEGSLRCKVLLEIIDPSLLQRTDFSVFADVHERTSHLRTHSARKELSLKERLDEDRQRMAVEAEFETPLVEAARGVLDFKERWPGSLG